MREFGDIHDISTFYLGFFFVQETDSLKLPPYPVQSSFDNRQNFIWTRQKTKSSTPPDREMELEQNHIVGAIEYPAARRSGKPLIDFLDVYRYPIEMSRNRRTARLEKAECNESKL